MCQYFAEKTPLAALGWTVLYQFKGSLIKLSRLEEFQEISTVVLCQCQIKLSFKVANKVEQHTNNSIDSFVVPYSPG